jgi:gamma-glutamylcyclotransferase
MANIYQENMPDPFLNQSSSKNATASTNGETTAASKLYFAYGSNLSSTQMAQRCPGATAVGLAHLSGWDWIINERHYANVVQRQPVPLNGAAEKADPGVYGVLYRLPPADEKELDLCEGVPWAYQKVMLEVTMISAPDSESGTDEEQEKEKYNQIVTTSTAAAAAATTTTASKAVSALVYVDFDNVRPADPMPEYVGRMGRGVREAHRTWGFPEWFADRVMKKYIPGLEWKEKKEIRVVNN